MRPSDTFIGQPIRSLQTMLRVIAENDPDFTRIIPDGIYGPETIRAVSRFQQEHGLPVTGVTNQETWDAVAKLYEDSIVEQEEAEALNILMEQNHPLRRGDSHPHVLLVQSMLSCLSDTYHCIAAPAMSGTLDDMTADSITGFQQICSLPMNGQLDKTTWKNLALQYPLAVTFRNKYN